MDSKTFRDVVRENKDRVFSHALYLLRCQEDAEDATQEVFARLWKHRERVARRSVAAWIMRTAHRLCIDLLRQRQTAAFRLRQPPGVDMDAFPARADRRTDPERCHEYTRRQEALLQAMGKLPETTRSILLLHYFHGLAYETIAEILGTKAGTARVAVHRGRKALRKLLVETVLESTGRYRHENAVRQDQGHLGSLPERRPAGAGERPGCRTSENLSGLPC